eukprot:1892539-Rhodomonas_salina.1
MSVPIIRYASTNHTLCQYQSYAMPVPIIRYASTNHTLCQYRTQCQHTLCQYPAYGAQQARCTGEARKEGG